MDIPLHVIILVSLPTLIYSFYLLLLRLSVVRATPRRREPVIRTSVREIALHRQVGRDRYVPVGIMGWRYSIEVLTEAPRTQHRLPPRNVCLHHGNQRHSLLCRLWKWLHHPLRRTPERCILPPATDHHTIR